jgi:hypothetical protein
MEDIYMFKVEDILARLQNGENASDIADEMVGILNEANHQFQKEEEEKARKAEEEAKAKKAEHEAHLKETQKLADLQEIIDLIHDFCIEYYCETNEDIDTVEEAFKELDAKSVNEIIKNLGIYAVKMSELEKHLLVKKNF